jgi:hypothetical protein
MNKKDEKRDERELMKGDRKMREEKNGWHNEKVSEGRGEREMTDGRREKDGAARTDNGRATYARR